MTKIADKNKLGENISENLQELVLSNPKTTNKNFIIGSIYLFYNNNNSKIYIGKTIFNYNYRFNEHFYNAFTKEIQNYFYKALRKHKWESFDKYIIYQTDKLLNNEENKNNINEILNEKEIYYIHYCKSILNYKLYNLTDGGNGCVGIKHSEEQKGKWSKERSGELHPNFGNFNNKTSIEVMQFDLDLNLIKIWPSISQINRDLGFDETSIGKCCSKKSDTCKGFLWVKSSDYIEGYFDYLKERIHIIKNTTSIYAVKSKSVFQYDFLGNLIKEWISPAEVSRFYNCDSSLISGAANGKFPMGKNFIWIYIKDFTQELLNYKIETVKSCRFYNKIIENLK